MAASGGWVALNREILDSYLWTLPPPQRVVAITILVSANWKRGETFSGGERVVIERGQLMTSLPSLAKLCRIKSIQTIRTGLLNLKKAQFLTWTSTAHYRVITITNYERYQRVDDEANSQINRRVTDAQQTPNRDRTREQGNKGNQKRDLSFSLQSDRPKTKRSRKAHRDPATLEIVDRVVGAFNDTFGRKLGAAGFYDVISRCLGAGYVDAQLRGVVWWSAFEWPEDHDYRGKLSPTTLFKMQGGNRCFPTYLALATEHWPKVYPGKALPWPNQ